MLADQLVRRAGPDRAAAKEYAVIAIFVSRVCLILHVYSFVIRLIACNVLESLEIVYVSFAAGNLTQPAATVPAATPTYARHA